MICKEGIGYVARMQLGKEGIWITLDNRPGVKL